MGQGQGRLPPGARPAEGHAHSASARPPVPHAPSRPVAPSHEQTITVPRREGAGPGLSRHTLKSYMENQEAFSATLREKELAQARWLQEQRVETEASPPLSPAEIDSLSQGVNITSRPMVDASKQSGLTEGTGLVKQLAANRRKALSRERTGTSEDVPVTGKLTTGQLQQLLHMHAATWKTKDLAGQFKVDERIVANITKHYRLLRPDE